jgi:hypothetical protein
MSIFDQILSFANLKYQDVKEMDSNTTLNYNGRNILLFLFLSNDRYLYNMSDIIVIEEQIRIFYQALK